jgi:conjugal transfer pilus assembly protein TrbC
LLRALNLEGRRAVAGSMLAAIRQRLALASFLLAIAGIAWADEPPTATFAPGATGAVGIDVPGLLNRAEEDAAALGRSLKTMTPAGIGDWDGKVQDLESMARQDPRVRALLGVDPGTGGTETAGQGEKPGYGEARILVFASLGMPEHRLRQIFRDADRYGATVVLRGFLGNSVIKTGEVLRRVLPGELSDGGEGGDGSDAVDTAPPLGAFNADDGVDVGQQAISAAAPSRAGGLAVDPTLFTRFGVKAVPVYVVLAEPLASCESKDCAEDPLPRHDRVAGNIDLPAALDIAARAGGDAAAVAQAALTNGAASGEPALTSAQAGASSKQ